MYVANCVSAVINVSILLLALLALVAVIYVLQVMI
jgi:hypothetical protein